MSGTGQITHVSDTARWTALHRATESARPDALFSDPLAEHLAGEGGCAIVARVPWMTRNGGLVARTKIIDDAIAEAIADGCDLVLNRSFADVAKCWVHKCESAAGYIATSFQASIDLGWLGRVPRLLVPLVQHDPEVFEGAVEVEHVARPPMLVGLFGCGDRGCTLCALVFYGVGVKSLER